MRFRRLVVLAASFSAALVAASGCWLVADIVAGTNGSDAGGERADVVVDDGFSGGRDGAYEAGDARNADGCTPDATQCFGGGVETCSASGQWGSPVPCSDGASPYGGSIPFCAIGPSGPTCGAYPPSCAGGGSGMTDCNGSDNCCRSFEVLGGRFLRSYDGMTYTDEGNEASVSSFRLDKYEVTVGRFGKFVDAWNKGWTPAPGSGKHTHLNGGQGLADVGADSGLGNDGWQESWDMIINANAASGWTGLACDIDSATWGGGNPNAPINCVTWYEAYAFCIWDGGFLPSEAEWNYAAAGGGGDSGQRVYPWSVPSTDAAIDCVLANYSMDWPDASCVGAANPVGRESPNGDGPFGQADMAGNLWEWTLDWNCPYVNPCRDCANLTSSLPPCADPGDAGAVRVIRGGSFAAGGTASLLVSGRGEYEPGRRGYADGIRCARIP